MLLSLRKNGLTSLFKEVRVFKEMKFLGRIFLGHQGPDVGISRTKTLCKWFFCCFRQGVAGMSRDLGRDVPDLEKLYARKLWADFRSPDESEHFVPPIFTVPFCRAILK